MLLFKQCVCFHLYPVLLLHVKVSRKSSSTTWCNAVITRNWCIAAKLETRIFKFSWSQYTVKGQNAQGSLSGKVTLWQLLSFSMDCDAQQTQSSHSKLRATRVWPIQEKQQGQSKSLGKEPPVEVTADTEEKRKHSASRESPKMFTMPKLRMWDKLRATVGDECFAVSHDFISKI